MKEHPVRGCLGRIIMFWIAATWPVALIHPAWLGWTVEGVWIALWFAVLMGRRLPDRQAAPPAPVSTPGPRDWQPSEVSPFMDDGRRLI